MQIAFIGFGEAGQTISRGLLAEQGVRIRTYDILFDDPTDQGKLRRAADALGVAAARDHVDAVRGAELIRAIREALGRGDVPSASG